VFVVLHHIASNKTHENMQHMGQFQEGEQLKLFPRLINRHRVLSIFL